jgi:hypothetical protein
MRFMQIQFFVIPIFFAKFHYFSISSQLIVVHFENQLYASANFQQDLCFDL